MFKMTVLPFHYAFINKSLSVDVLMYFIEMKRLEESCCQVLERREGRYMSFLLYYICLHFHQLGIIYYLIVK